MTPTGFLIAFFVFILIIIIVTVSAVVASVSDSIGAINDEMDSEEEQ